MRALIVDDSRAIRSMQQALEAGANEYVMKPFTEDVLREKLQLVGLGAA